MTAYTIDERELQSLCVLCFEAPNREWLRFVASNRKGEGQTNEWDLVYGPVANDQMMPVINLFLDGMYDEEETIKRLLPQKLKDQYAFKTLQAIRLLRCTEVISL